MDTPLVSALMVTRNRRDLAKRALACLSAQSWPAIELVVVDDGEQDYTPVLEPHRDRLRVRYLKVAHDPRQKLGALRNLALSHASGDFMTQWDDDEWSHPERIATQLEHLRARDADAVELRYYLLHLNVETLAAHPFRCDSSDGAPGSILHRRTDLRYPNLARSEDLAFEQAFHARGRMTLLGLESSHLMVRCYHGTNTWDRTHFERKLERGLRGLLHQARTHLLGADPLRHPGFHLCEREARSARAFLEQSRHLGLVTP